MSNQYKFDETTGKWLASGAVLSGVNSVNGLAGDVTYLPVGIVTTTSGDVSPPVYAKVYTGDTAPAVPVTGDIWIDSTYGSGTSNILRWRKIAGGGETSLSGVDTSGLTLVYTPGYEQLYINGVLQYRGSDYVATTGTTITGITALAVSDTIEVVAPSALQVGDYYTQAQVAALLALTTPIGTVNPYAGSTAPTNWLICDGTTKSIAANPELANLYAVIGTTYGGTSSSSFKLPDLRGRSPIGVGTGTGLTARALADAVGVESVTLTGAQSGTSAHTHLNTLTGGDHNHTALSFLSDTGSGINALQRAAVAVADTSYNSAGATDNAVVSINNVASVAANAAQAHENMQPSLALNYIIKAV